MDLHGPSFSGYSGALIFKGPFRSTTSFVDKNLRNLCLAIELQRAVSNAIKASISSQSPNIRSKISSGRSMKWDTEKRAWEVDSRVPLASSISSFKVEASAVVMEPAVAISNKGVELVQVTNRLNHSKGEAQEARLSVDVAFPFFQWHHFKIFEKPLDISSETSKVLISLEKFHDSTPFPPPCLFIPCRSRRRFSASDLVRNCEATSSLRVGC